MNAQTAETVTIPKPNFKRAVFEIEGTAPYVQARFSEKAMAQMRDKMLAGSQGRKGTARKARDFEADFKGAQHLSKDGWIGIPAPAIRNACISACRVVGFKMTIGKLSVFAEHDGIDAVDGTPLIRIKGKPRAFEMHARNASGVVDIRVRPMWETWSAKVTLRWDADQFSATDVTNLLSRAGQQVGIGEGRPDSKASAGLGFGLFRVNLLEELAA